MWKNVTTIFPNRKEFQILFLFTIKTSSLCKQPFDIASKPARTRQHFCHYISLGFCSFFFLFGCCFCLYSRLYSFNTSSLPLFKYQPNVFMMWKIEIESTFFNSQKNELEVFKQDARTCSRGDDFFHSSRTKSKDRRFTKSTSPPPPTYDRAEWRSGQIGRERC